MHVQRGGHWQNSDNRSRTSVGTNATVGIWPGPSYLELYHFVQLIFVINRYLRILDHIFKILSSGSCGPWVSPLPSTRVRLRFSLSGSNRRVCGRASLEDVTGILESIQIFNSPCTACLAFVPPRHALMLYSCPLMTLNKK